MKSFPYYGKEIQLLLLLSRSQLKPENIAQVHELLSQSLNWSYILAVAQKHKLASLIFANLSEKFSEQTDQANYKLFRNMVERYVRSNLLLTQSMLQLVTYFQDKGYSFIPFKGPTLSHLAYQKPFHRYFEDLDFLVPKDEFQGVCDELLKIGLVSNFRNDPKYYRQSQFGSVQTQVVLDIHYALTPVDCFVQVDTLPLLSKLQSTQINGIEFKTFSAEDTLIILCVDAAKGYWRSILRLVDMAELIRNQSLNWTVLESRARSLSVLRLVEMGLLLTQTLLDAPVPADLEFFNRSPIQMQLDESTLHRQVFKLQVTWPQSWQWHCYNFQELTTLLSKIQYFYRLGKFSLRHVPGIQQMIKT